MFAHCPATLVHTCYSYVIHRKFYRGELIKCIDPNEGEALRRGSRDILPRTGGGPEGKLSPLLQTWEGLAPPYSSAYASHTRQGCSGQAIHDKAVQDKPCTTRLFRTSHARQGCSGQAIHDKAVQDKPYTTRLFRTNHTRQGCSGQAIHDKAVQDKAVHDKAVQDKAVHDKPFMTSLFRTRLLMTRTSVGYNDKRIRLVCFWFIGG